MILLMFNLGLEFSFTKLLSVGRTAVITGPFEAGFMLALGYFVGRGIGWNSTDSIFLGAILSISSTAIIIKALEELGLKKERFAELIFGVLVIEDLVGILILVALTLLAKPNELTGTALLWESFRLFLILASWIALGLLIVPRLINYIGKRSNDETLTLASLSLCLGLVVVSAYFHYSIALGAFVMGSLVAESSELHRIEKLILPIRHAFAAIFFISTGMLLNPVEIVAHWKIILLVTALTVFGKIFSTTLGSLLSGQKLPTSVRIGFGLAQIGEFSFIIGQLGLSLGIMKPVLYTIAVSVSVITTFVTPYLIRMSKQVAIAVRGP